MPKNKPKYLFLAIEINDDSDGVVEARAALRDYQAAKHLRGPGENLDCYGEVHGNKYRVSISENKPKP